MKLIKNFLTIKNSYEYFIEKINEIINILDSHCSTFNELHLENNTIDDMCISIMKNMLEKYDKSRII